MNIYTILYVYKQIYKAGEYNENNEQLYLDINNSTFVEIYKYVIH